jgi:hypothetical protein
VNQVDLGTQALWTLIPISALSGLLAIVVFRACSDQDAIRRASNRLMAHLMEFRLFIDEPALIIRAQRDLLIDNWRLLRLLFRPSLILAVPFFVLIPQLDSLYGRAPLELGKPAVVTVQTSTGLEPGSSLRLKAPAAIAVETAGVHVARLRQISWRITSHRDGSEDLEVIGPSQVVTKTIASGRGVHRISAQRTSSIGAFLLDPIEAPISDPVIRSIRIEYPSATIFHLHWLVWFSVISSVAALLLLAFPQARLLKRHDRKTPTEPNQ